MTTREKEKHQEVVSMFARTYSKSDLLELLNFINESFYGEDCFSFNLEELNCYIYDRTTGYTHFIVKKKNGDDRIICAPDSRLKQVQRCLNILFQALYTPQENAFGYIKGKSIVDNAKVHVGNRYVYNIDLKDFFSSIHIECVFKRLQHHPFNLNVQNGRSAIARMIAALCCHKIENTSENIQEVLPQGAPTSPILTNIICEKLDYLLESTARRFNLKYSRYVDDITFSSMHNIYQDNGKFILIIKQIIEAQGFLINEAKTRLQKKGFRQEVTGLIVNDKVNVHKGYIKELRKWLYYWETYGYDRANSYFQIAYQNKMRKGNPSIENVLVGKLEYLKMVKGFNNATYLNLKMRFDKLIKGIAKHEEGVEWKRPMIDRIRDNV